jgi:glycosyltransferase involved in cell wall biosynthesis
MIPPRVCICMTTFNPPEKHFIRQVDSLRAQNFGQWTCLVQDDHSGAAGASLVREVLSEDVRFRIEQNETTLGFYENFERVLSRVPSDCDLVCLADQDDLWYPHKLATLVEVLREPESVLAWGNMRVTDAEGNTLAERFTTSSPARIRFESHFFTNTIPGAACMFRASLLPKVLPFPAKRGIVYHDWWITLVARAAGRIRFVDDVLQDYVQHDSNAVGWKRKPRAVSPARLVTSADHRREMLQTARKMLDEDCVYLANAIQALRERMPDSRHFKAMRRLHGLLTHPRRTMMLQYLRALRSRNGSRRQRNLLLAQLLGRGSESRR